MYVSPCTQPLATPHTDPRGKTAGQHCFMFNLAYLITFSHIYKIYNFPFLYMEATSELPQYTTAIYCTKYCALSGLNSFFVMCFARSKYSSTVNWSALFETYIRRTPTIGRFLRCFQSFSAIKLPKCDGHLSLKSGKLVLIPTVFICES